MKQSESTLTHIPNCQSLKKDIKSGSSNKAARGVASTSAANRECEFVGFGVYTGFQVFVMQGFGRASMWRS